VPDLNPERPEQTGLYGQAHAGQNHQWQQQQPQPRLGRWRFSDVD
jgi:hypothetical protein